MANGPGGFRSHRSGQGLILAIETSCDDTCAALVTRAGEIRSNVVASQGLLHARYGGVVPEVASRRHLELLDAVVADALEAGRASLDDVETVAVTRGPGLIGALLVGVSSAKALAARAQAAARAGRPPARPRGGEHARRRADRAALPVPGRERRAHVPGPRRRPLELRGARPDARRRRGRGVRQGRAPAGPGLPRRARARPARRGGRPGGVRLPALGARRRSTSRSAASRPRCSTRCATSARRRPATGAPTWPRPTSARSSTPCSRAPAPRSSARACGGSPWAVAWPPTPSSARALGRSSTPRFGSRRWSSAPTTPR